MAAAQTVPTYSNATVKPEEPIVRELVAKYGYANISWPIILSNEGRTIAYLYEINEKNKINSEHGCRPSSSSGLPNFFLDYTSNPRKIAPRVDFLINFIDEKFSCSYDYIIKTPSRSHLSTVDLDYVWNFGDGFKGFELTTFWMDFYSPSRAAELVSTMCRRPSWKGVDGAHALHKIVDCAEDLGIDYYLVCVNTLSKEVGSNIKTSGNVFFFRLNHRQIERLSRGLPPQDYQFCNFSQFLDWL